MIWALALLACNPDPGHPEQGVEYRGPLGDEPQSGERGNIKISEVMWSGSVTNDGVWDQTDVYVEIRNEGAFPIDVQGWMIEMSGARETTIRLPAGPVIGVGEHVFMAAKTTGCFPEPDWVVPDLAFVYGEPFRLTLVDFDEHLIEPVGDREMPPFAGGYDGVLSRSMERVELMFGGEGSRPHMWHYYTPAPVDVPNNDRIAEACRDRTRGSPGRPNSPDYSGAYASGSFE